jgi:isoleucyl-tRNA synthetase
VLTHGFTVDEQGRKMSKSLGNVVAPQTVVKDLGADVLRLWVAASDYRGEIAVSNELLKRIADAYRRIRNTARYLLGSLHGFDPARHAVSPEKLLAVDAWALAQAAQLQAELRTAYRDADYHLVYQKLHNYCVVDLGGLYLDILKDRLYTMPEAHPARRSAQTVLWHLAEAMVRWIAPILSFTADEIWRLLPGDRATSVFAQPWYPFPVSAGRETAIDWIKLLAARDAVKKVLEDLRIRGVIGSSLDADVRLYADGDMLTALRSLATELRFWFITSEAVASALNDKPTDAVEATAAGAGALWIAAAASPHEKCQRCWHHRADIGAVAAHLTLCSRCATNVSGAGEVRRFV